jgi:hypothetical protein
VTVTVTAVPALSLLSVALCLASVAASARSACLLAVFAVSAFTRTPRPAGPVYGWQGAACALTSAALFSAALWQLGVLYGGVTAVCAFLWQREREHGKGLAAGGGYG